MKPDTPLHNAPTDAAARKAVTPVIALSRSAGRVAEGE